MNDSSVKCSVCGVVIEQPEPRRPCENCGATARTMEVRIESVAAASDGFAEVTHERVHPRPWTERWRRVGGALERLRTVYTHQGPLEADGLHDAISKFFLESSHLLDSLANDPSTRLSENAIRNYIRTTILEVGLAFANTDKHTVRNAPNAVTAYVSQEGERLGQRFATIKYWSASRPPQQIDALELAERCYDAWRVFLINNGLL